MVKKILSILIKLALIVIGTLGVIFTASMAGGFMGTSYTFHYFTVQSNVTIIAIIAVFLINELLPKKFVNQIFYYIKFVFTIAITITFIVFFAVLLPTGALSTSYILSFNNFSLHAIVPILAIVDFFLFDTDIDMTYPKSMFGLGMPLYYLAYYFIGLPLGFVYGKNVDGTNITAPYFFLNFDESGVFFEKGTVGVVPWCIILGVAMAGLCLLFALLMRLRQGKLRK